MGYFTAEYYYGGGSKLRAHWLFEERDAVNELDESFANFANLAYSVACEGMAMSLELAVGNTVYETSLTVKQACERACREVRANPSSVEIKYFHLFEINAELADLLGIYPEKAKVVGLAIRSHFLDIASWHKKNIFTRKATNQHN